MLHKYCTVSHQAVLGEGRIFVLFLTLQLDVLKEDWKVHRSFCSHTRWPESEFFKDIIWWLQDIEQEVLINNPSRLSQTDLVSSAWFKVVTMKN